MDKKNVHHIEIFYCPKCRWLPRASWIAQEILTTFQNMSIVVSLCPAESGRFEITIDNKVLFNRSKDYPLPDPKKLKQKIRDIIAPEMNLGHSDKNNY